MIFITDLQYSWYTWTRKMFAGFTYDKDDKMKCLECGVDDVHITDEMSMIFQHSQLCEFFRNEYMAKKENRLKTFEKWPSSSSIVDELAYNGFYYKGPWIDEQQCMIHDAVYCVHCNIMVFGWDKAHNVKKQHRIHSTFHRSDMQNPCPFTI